MEKMAMRMSAKISDPLRVVMEIAELVEQENPIDRRRIYLTGFSRGAFATWDLICRFPQKFAAAVPVCGGGDPTCVAQIAKIPIWAFHGQKDDVVPVECTRVMIDALRRIGSNPRYTEYRSTKHNSWTPAYAGRELLDWLFQQAN